MTTARLSSKSQIVVPADVRRRLGLKPGDEVVIVVEGDHAILRRIDRSPLQALRQFAEAHGHIFEGYDVELDKARDDLDRKL